MARMIPESPGSDVESKAEVRLFERLRDDVSNDFVAFHHVAWLSPGGKRRPSQGEADFVVAHPELGLLVIEVKGGTISYEASAGTWSSTGREGTFPIKDPFEQARRTAFSLRKLLERSKRVDDDRFYVGYGVAFPDTRADTARLRPDAPREILVDGGDVRNLQARLRRVFSYWKDEDRPAPLGEGLAHVESVLGNSFELRAPLGLELAEEERELLRLTEEQYGVLDLLSRQTRVAIAGCAARGRPSSRPRRRGAWQPRDSASWSSASTRFWPSICAAGLRTLKRSMSSRSTTSATRSCARQVSTSRGIPSRARSTATTPPCVRPSPSTST